MLRSVRILYNLQNCLRKITTTTFLESPVATSTTIVINAHATNVSTATTIIRGTVVKTANYVIILKTIVATKSNRTQESLVLDNSWIF